MQIVIFVSILLSAMGKCYSSDLGPPVLLVYCFRHTLQINESSKGKMLAFIMTHIRTALAMDLANIQACLESLYGEEVTCRDSRNGEFYCARHYEVYNRYTESVSEFSPFFHV